MWVMMLNNFDVFLIYNADLNSPYYECHEIDELSSTPEGDINNQKLKVAFVSCVYYSG